MQLFIRRSSGREIKENRRGYTLRNNGEDLSSPAVKITAGELNTG